MLDCAKIAFLGITCYRTVHHIYGPFTTYPRDYTTFGVIYHIILCDNGISVIFVISYGKK